MSSVVCYEMVFQIKAPGGTLYFFLLQSLAAEQLHDYGESTVCDCLACCWLVEHDQEEFFQ